MSKIKVKSIQSTGQGLYGITENGEVIVYLGYKTGWQKLNMNVMSEKEASKEWKKRNNKDNTTHD